MGQRKEFDFSEFGPKQNSLSPKKEMEEKEVKEFDFSQFGPSSDKKNIKQDDMDLQEKPKTVNTFLGEMPTELPQLKRGSKEYDQLITDMMESAIGNPGLKAVVQAPFKLSLKNIANKIIEAKNKEKLFHSGQYKKIFDSAKEAGLDKVRLNTKYTKDVNVIKENSSKKYYKSLDKFINNPTLENAQKSQSDLGKLLNSHQLNKDVLTSEERLTRKSAEKLQEYIKDKMFRDSNGKLNKELKDQYDKISSSYGKNFKPYDIKQIKLFEQGKRTPEQLVKSLKSGSFMAERGKFHPEIKSRAMTLDALKQFGIPATSGIGLGFYLRDKLLGNRE